MCAHLVVSSSLQPVVAHQPPLSMGFLRQDYWSGLPFPTPGDLPDAGIEPWSPVSSPALTSGFFTTVPPGKSKMGEEDGETVGCKIGSRMYYTTWRIFVLIVKGK